ncbi:futalosine hydrolase [Streptomyces sp. O3]
MRVLMVTAVAAEADAVTAGLPAAAQGRGAGPGSPVAPRVDVLAAGVGPAAAAAGTARALTAAALAGEPYDLVVSAGIGGGFAPDAPVGSVVVADAIVAADLGAETADGFLPVTELGFGTVEHRPPAALVRAAADAAAAARTTGAVLTGAVLTVSTVTGTAERAARLRARHPDAVAEAMEGFGVAEAAAAQGCAVLELRAVSNPVGPRDRAAWRIGDALAALTETCAALAPALAHYESSTPPEATPAHPEAEPPPLRTHARRPTETP